jgi:hypothetical protein
VFSFLKHAVPKYKTLAALLHAHCKCIQAHLKVS